MIIYFNLANGNISLNAFDAVAYTNPIPVKLEDNAALQVAFHTNGVLQLVAAGSLINFIMKDPPDYTEETPLTAVSSFSTPGDTTGFYTAYPDFGTAPLEAALTPDDTPEGIPFYDTMCEIVLRQYPLFAKQSSSTFTVRVFHNLLQGDEATPPPGIASPYVLHLPGITALTGGTSVDLDDMVTVGMQSYSTRALVIGGQVLIARLEPTSLSAGGATEVTPVDYNAGTNPYKWRIRPVSITEVDPVFTAALTTDNTLSANSDTKVASQKAIKAYVDAAKAYAIQRANHTGTQTLSTISDAGTAAAAALDTDASLTANSNTRVPSQAAVKSYVSTMVTGLLSFKGNFSGSGSPNYPAGVKGDAYYINVAGKVGGGSGKSVDIGDTLVCSNNNAGGTEGSVGASWFVLEHNLVGALVAFNNLSELTATAATARTNLGLGTASTHASGDFDAAGAAAAVAATLGTSAALNVDTDTTMSANSDSVVPSQAAVVAYVAAHGGGGSLPLDTDYDTSIITMSARGLIGGQSSIMTNASGDILIQAGNSASGGSFGFDVGYYTPYVSASSDYPGRGLFFDPSNNLAPRLTWDNNASASESGNSFTFDTGGEGQPLIVGSNTSGGIFGFGFSSEGMPVLFSAGTGNQVVGVDYVTQAGYISDSSNSGGKFGFDGGQNAIIQVSGSGQHVELKSNGGGNLDLRLTNLMNSTNLVSGHVYEWSGDISDLTAFLAGGGKLLAIE